MELLRLRGQPTKFFKTTDEMSVWVNKTLAVRDQFDVEIIRATEVIRGQMAE